MDYKLSNWSDLVPMNGMLNLETWGHVITKN
jgi:hypothetical protein